MRLVYQINADANLNYMLALVHEIRSELGWFPNRYCWMITVPSPLTFRIGNVLTVAILQMKNTSPDTL